MMNIQYLAGSLKIATWTYCIFEIALVTVLAISLIDEKRTLGLIAGIAIMTVQIMFIAWVWHSVKGLQQPNEERTR